MKTKSGFKLSKLDELLQVYYLDETVSAYVSKVAPDEQTRLIQVVFAEDSYTAKSAEMALEFFKKLSASKALREKFVFGQK